MVRFGSAGREGGGKTTTTTRRPLLLLPQPWGHQQRERGELQSGGGVREARSSSNLFPSSLEVLCVIVALAAAAETAALLVFGIRPNDSSGSAAVGAITHTHAHVQDFFSVNIAATTYQQQHRALPPKTTPLATVTTRDLLQDWRR